MIAPGNHWIYDSLRGAPPREKHFGATLWNAGDGVPYGEILPKRVRDNHRTTGETGPGNQNHRHCEPVGRGNLQHHLSSLIAPINIVYPELSMLTYLSVYPTAAMEIATA